MASLCSPCFHESDEDQSWQINPWTLLEIAIRSSMSCWARFEPIKQIERPVPILQNRYSTLQVYRKLKLPWPLTRRVRPVSRVYSDSKNYATSTMSLFIFQPLLTWPTWIKRDSTVSDLTKLLVAKGNSSAPCLSRGQSKPKSGSYIPQINPAPTRRFSEQPVSIAFRTITKNNWYSRHLVYVYDVHAPQAIYIQHCLSK